MEGEKNFLKVRILYVEDEAITRLSITQFLADKVEQIYTAENGAIGLELYKKYQPDVILTDIRMPVMSGLEMIQAIRQDNPDIPVIVATAYSDSSLLAELINLDTTQFVSKPIVQERLFQALEKCVRSCFMEDELRSMAVLLKEYKNAIDSSSIVLKFDKKGAVIYVNNAYCRLASLEKEEILNKPVSMVPYPESPENTEKQIWDTILSKNIWKGILKDYSKKGVGYFLSTTVLPILDGNGKIEEFISIGYEVTELIEKEKELVRQLYYDRTTDLPNRSKLLKDVEEAFSPVLMIINIDSFQEVNDFYGNEIGDFLMNEMGKRLVSLLPSEDYRLYKMPTDEYAILLDKKDIPNKQLEVFIRSIVEEINEKPYFYKDQSVNLTSAIGIAFEKEEEGVTQGKWRNLALKADMALKKAKRTRKHYIIYDDSMQIKEEYANNINWTRKLKDAIKNGRIVPFFQPIYNNHTNCVEKYECLVRMLDKDGKVNAPLLFLEMSKKSKLYHHITKIMIEKSFEAFQSKDYEFSINLSVDDMLDEDTNSFIVSLLKKNQKTAKRAVFEILESEGIENYEQVKSFIENIKSFQAKIAIDDFGSGYSNFSHILGLSVDYLKIDASLTKNIHQDKNTQIVAETIVDFSKRLGIKTIAEFVHSQEVFEKVKNIGVDYSQGYYFGKPEMVF